MKIIIANWKMNQGFDEIDQWLDGFYEIYRKNFEQMQSVRVIICPPAIFLDYLDSELIDEGLNNIQEIAKKEGREAQDFSPEEVNEYVMESRLVRLGAQDCHYEKAGSFTGEVSAKMLHSVGCEYVIIGHSERRINNHESNDIVSKKLRAVINEGMIPILCVGEELEVRNSSAHLQFVKDQLIAAMAEIKNPIPALLVAYEPVWAIGNGETAKIGQINEMVNSIVRLFQEGDLAGKVGRIFVLYGGSVNEQNSKEILGLEKIDGLLVGKASLDVKNFMKLCLENNRWSSTGSESVN